jgi:putative peptide zinc metalloprotease protein
MTTAMPDRSPAANPVVVALRQELRLFEGERDATGAQRWLIYDPLQHRFFSIGETGHVLLQLWREGAKKSDIIDDAWSQFAVALGEDDIKAFELFIFGNGLTVAGITGDWRHFHSEYLRRKSSALMSLVHGYVFARVPLTNPDRFLEKTLPIARRFATRGAVLGISVAGITGLYLVSREWDAFLSTLVDIFTVSGAIMTTASLVFLKILHELAHGYTAKHYGCRVPVMGVAFIMAFPMLYTDVTDAWRLPSRRQRIMVGAAGMLMDLAVSCLAIFAWAFLPAGPAKSASFSLATTAWLLSISMNISPLMKFDGYHMLVDWLGLENLHARAIALAQWRLREILFDLKRPPPESLRPRLMAGFCGFGFAICIYRFVLFTGIALAVYVMFVKVVGIVLFLVEIVYFILGPIWRELREWIKMRKEILSSRRSRVTGAILAAVLGVVVLPWSSTVRIPAVLEAQGIVQVHPPVAARVEAVAMLPGQSIGKGAALVSLAAPLLRRELQLAEKKLAVIALRQSRRTSDESDRQAAVVLDQEAAALNEKRLGLLRQLGELVVLAPGSAYLAEMRPGLHAGQWVGMADPLFVMRSETDAGVRGVVDAADIWRVREGQNATFIPDDFLLPSVAVQVASITSGASEALDQLELIANFGGRVTAHLDSQGRAVPESAQYPIRAIVAGTVSPDMLQKSVVGVLIVNGLPESLLARVWRQTVRVVVRESGF